jgi:hypothetical protein
MRFESWTIFEASVDELDKQHTLEMTQIYWDDEPFSDNSEKDD